MLPSKPQSVQKGEVPSGVPPGTSSKFSNKFLIKIEKVMSDLYKL